MIWVQPAALIALAALTLPVALHLLARRRAPRLRFPTLRFIAPTRLASLRRRALDDPALLAVRLLILGAAIAASAGPFLVTAARRRVWDARTTQAVVEDPRAIAGAVAGLQREPPARREIVVRSALPLGSVNARDVAAVPPHIGLRFERTGALPPTRSVPAASVLTLSDAPTRALESIDREIILTGDRTTVRESRRGVAATVAVEISLPDGERAATDAILDALFSDRLPAAVASRSARIEFASPSAANAEPKADGIRQPWMGDAAASIIRDALPPGRAASQLTFGSSDGRLVVSTSMHATDVGAPALVRSVFNALGRKEREGFSRAAAEILPIPDRQLAAWSRPPGAAPAPSPETIRDDDRRGFWAAALLLLAIEWRIRGARTGRQDADDASARESRVA